MPFDLAVPPLALDSHIRTGIGATCVPIGLLVDVIAGADVDFCTFSLVVGLVVDARVVDDGAGVIAVSAVSSGVMAGRNILQ